MYEAECDECGRTFYNWDPWQSVQQHKEAVHYYHGDYDDDQEWDTDDDDYSDEESEEEEPWCQYCQRSFDCQHSLGQHMRVSFININSKAIPDMC